MTDNNKTDLGDIFVTEFKNLSEEVEPWGNQEEALQKFKHVLTNKEVDVIALNAPVASGKCLAPNQRIWTPDGYKEIQKIFEEHKGDEKPYDGEGRWYDTEGDFTVLSMGEDGELKETQPTSLFRQEYEGKLYRVELTDGSTITISPNHELLGGYGWNKPEEIEEGQFIGVPKQLPSQESSSLSHKVAKLLAYEIGEGHEVDTEGTCFTTITQSNREVLENLKQTVESLGLKKVKPGPQKQRGEVKTNLDISPVIQETDTSWELKINSLSFKEYLEEEHDIVFGTLSRGKQIPDTVLQARKSVKAEFIKHFYDAEGSYSEGEIEFPSASKELLQQMRKMLLEFGIWSRLRHKPVNGEDYWRLMVSGRDLDTYKEKIGSERKEIPYSGSEDTNVHLIPFKGIFEKFRKKNIPIPDDNDLSSYKGQDVTREKLGGFVDYLKDFRTVVKGNNPNKFWHDDKKEAVKELDPEWVDRIISEVKMKMNSDVNWSKVKSVEEVEHSGYIYDVSVPEKHNYVAENIVSHNSFIHTALANSLKKQNANAVYIAPLNSLLDQIKNDEVIGDYYTVLKGKGRYECETAKNNRKIELTNGRQVPVLPAMEKADKSPSTMYENFPYEDKFGPCCNWRRIDEDEDLGNFDEACPYAQAMYRTDRVLSDSVTRFSDSNLILTNLDLFLRSNVFREDPKSGDDRQIDLLIVDEADTLKQKALNTATVELSESMISFIDRPFPNFHGNNAKVKQEIYEWMESTVKALSEKANNLREQEDLTIDDINKIQKIQRVQSQFENLNIITGADENGTPDLSKVMLKENKDHLYKLEPLEIGPFIRKKLLSNVDYCVLSSATINELYLENIGLDEGLDGSDTETEMIEISDRRMEWTKQIYVNPTVDMSSLGATTPENQELNLDMEEAEKMANKVSQIAKQFPDEKGIVHCYKYNLQQWMYKELQYRLGDPDRLFIMDSENREEDIEEFINSDGNKILLSVGNRRGLDLKGEHSRFNIIPKIPYPKPDKQRLNKRQNGWREYYNKTIQELSQATGRTTRGKDDWSATIILDERFPDLHERFAGLFPTWFEFTEIDDMEEISEGVKKAKRQIKQDKQKVSIN